MSDFGLSCCCGVVVRQKYDVIANQSALNQGMIATGNHLDFRFAARSTTDVAIPYGGAPQAFPSVITPV
jgi:hypothetical protein